MREYAAGQLQELFEPVAFGDIANGDRYGPHPNGDHVPFGNHETEVAAFAVRGVGRGLANSNRGEKPKQHEISHG